MADSPIIIWERNKIDLTNPNVVITVTDATADNDGQDFVDLMRNRRNDSGWATTQSNDAANTQLDIVMSEEPEGPGSSTSRARPRRLSRVAGHARR